MSRFLRPDTRTLTISDGDTLVVRARLTSGEQRAMFARMYLAGVDGTLKANPFQTGLAIVTAYLIDWSLRDDDNRLVVIRDEPLATLQAALDALEPESYAEIREAVEAHAAAMDAARAQEKKLPAGEMPSSATSPSLVGVAGGTSG